MQGVIYTGGEYPPFSQVRPYLHHDRMLVCADSGYHSARAHHLVPDVIIGDFDSIGDAVPDIPRISFPRDKDHTDTELAIAHCKKNGCTSTMLVGGGGGRIDHFLALLWLFEGEGRVNRWVLRNAMVEYVDKAWYKEGCAHAEIVSVLPIGMGPWRMASTGLRWPLHACNWQRHVVGISNEAVSSTVSITMTVGSILVIQNM